MARPLPLTANEANPSFGYCYGFNGMERDNDINGSQSVYDFGARVYDSRVARFFSVDPDFKKYPHRNPYNFSANNPIRWVDIDGRGPGDRVKKAIELANTKGIQYKQQVGEVLRTASTPEALEYMDCSEFVSRVLAYDGITNGVENLRSWQLHSKFENESWHKSQNPVVGDVAVWKGHVGIVTSVNSDGEFKMAHAANPSSGVRENRWHATVEDYSSHEFLGFYHPAGEDSELSILNELISESQENLQFMQEQRQFAQEHDMETEGWDSAIIQEQNSINTMQNRRNELESNENDG